MLKKKVCLVGSFGVGKTSLVSRFVEGVFSDRYLSTIGVKIDRKVVGTPAGEVALILWDMAGEERFEHLQTSYLRGAAGVIYVADGTRRETLDHAVEFAGRTAPLLPGAPGVLLLNKSDLAEEWELGEVSEVARRMPELPVILTSAKTGEGVEEAFVDLCVKMAGADE